MTALVAILLAPFAILTAFFAIEVLAGLRPVRTRGQRGPAASAVIVVPAHDEAAVIGETLRSLKDSLGERMRILVVADNCSDSTAERAREAGVEVVERNDPQRRGKGHALAFAADHLRPDPPDVIVVIDADCSTDARSLRALVDRAAVSGRPSQAINLLRPNREASPLVQLSTFGFMLKNLVRQRGLQRLAGRVHLTGTGMALPFVLFQSSGSVRSSIVEDFALGLELADAGHAPTLVSEAVVWSGSSTEQGTLVQRRRWEGGFLATALKQGPKMVWRGLGAADLRLVLAGLDMLVPPLALFALLSLAALTISSVAIFASNSNWWPVIVLAVLLGFAGFAIFLAWVREGRRFVSFAVLVGIPFYVIWKLPLYAGLVRRGAPGEWLRTGR